MKSEKMGGKKMGMGKGPGMKKEMGFSASVGKKGGKDKSMKSMASPAKDCK